MFAGHGVPCPYKIETANFSGEGKEPAGRQRYNGRVNGTKRNALVVATESTTSAAARCSCPRPRFEPNCVQSARTESGAHN